MAAQAAPVPRLQRRSWRGRFSVPAVDRSVGVIAGLFKDQLIAALEREIDEAADDAAALDAKTRAKKESERLSAFKGSRPCVAEASSPWRSARVFPSAR